MNQSIAQSRQHATRGWGLLEGFLSLQRAKMADRLISSNQRRGRILDIGCGQYPVFLLHVDFSEKIAMEKDISRLRERQGSFQDIALIEHDVESGQPLPLTDNFCDVITLLAVLEHLSDSASEVLLGEIHRVLKPGGVLIATTPASWTKPILWFMARTGLVSAIEIEEHQRSFTKETLYQALNRFFPENAVDVGSFELFVNLWAMARKELGQYPEAL